MKQDIRKKLAVNVRRIRLVKQLTQGDVCRATGIDRSYMSSLESGKRNPTILNLEKIAKALHVSADELLK